MKPPIETLVPRLTPFSPSRPRLGNHDRKLNGSTHTSQPPPNLRSNVRPDGVCVLTFDRPNSAANIFDRLTLVELREEIIRIAADPQIKGLVLNSAKPAIFIAGADLTSMKENASENEMREFIELGQDVMNHIADLSIPTVAAIHGAAVGGGCEICLACDYRVASTERATKIGLPETQIGLLPAWGGCTRLPRLIGLPKALDIILAGKTLAPKPALKAGLVDDLAPVEYLLERAVKILKQGKRATPKWRAVNTALAASIIGSRARSKVLKKTRGHYPAVTSALEVVTRGISQSVPDSLALERDRILELLQSATCHNLIRIFFMQERAKKRVVLASATKPPPIKNAAVIGAGVMGAGIAQWLSAKQVQVILRDINAQQVAKGMASLAKVYKEGTKRHAFTPVEARKGMDRIYPAPVAVPLKRVELVIEAAVEKLDLKKKVFAELDQLAGDETILATNTSALPVSELAAATRKPERVLGLHFFNPVHRMQLVEIVAAKQTSPEILQRALSFVQQIGKLPVVVKDSPGFLVNRILMPYLIEAGHLFEGGASVHELDEAMLDFGMPMGPMRLLDEVGIDVSLHVADTLAAHYGDRMAIPGVLQRMIKDGLLGRKSGKGFYLHPKGKDAVANSEAWKYVGPSAQYANTPRDILQQHMALLMVNEAARCMEEQIVTDPADVDFAMIMGTGFAPFRGGPLRYADSLGIDKVVDAMKRFADAGASHFAPCALLQSMAANKNKFYEK
jgi:3-hydroxyacyl-CoA dehydrogenase/enoyl-CoA hydratase/3-hydroxybutyryl-CoA epimerase